MAQGGVDTALAVDPERGRQHHELARAGGEEDGARRRPRLDAPWGHHGNPIILGSFDEKIRREMVFEDTFSEPDDAVPSVCDMR